MRRAIDADDIDTRSDADAATAAERLGKEGLALSIHHLCPHAALSLYDDVLTFDTHGSIGSLEWVR